MPDDFASPSFLFVLIVLLLTPAASGFSPHALFDVVATADAARYIATHHDVWRILRDPSNASLRRVTGRVANKAEADAIAAVAISVVRRPFWAEGGGGAAKQDMFSTLPQIEARM